MAYSTTSPYYNTLVTKGNYLGFLEKRPIPINENDILYEIGSQYIYRPDLLSFDLYGTPKLWWVFAQRNMEVLKDPIFDFLPGTSIYLPKRSTLSSLLGV
jgi:hypothetical protein